MILKTHIKCLTCPVPLIDNPKLFFMKKKFILFVFFLSVFISCRKENVCHLSEPETIISSEWLSLQFSPVFSSSSGNTQASQVSDYKIIPENKYDPKRYIKLAYIKNSERGYWFYWQIPGMVLMQHYAMDFSLTQNTFSVTVKDIFNQSQLPDSSILEGCRFRFVLIPKTDYSALSINWSDYYAVAAAFNLSL